MPLTEFVVPTLKTDPATEAAFHKDAAPFLVNILANHPAPPKAKYFGKILVENGNDVSQEFRLCMGLEWENSSQFDSFVASDNFAKFKTIVMPLSHAPPVPQLYRTDFEPGQVFGSALTEVWQVQIGEGGGKVAETKSAWEKFARAVAEAGGVDGNGKSIQGTSVNLEEKRWVGVLGWDSREIRDQVLGSAAVKEAKKGLDAFVWNTFVVAFAK